MDGDPDSAAEGDPDWAGLPAELLRRVAAAAPGGEDVCRAWRANMPVNLRHYLGSVEGLRALAHHIGSALPDAISRVLCHCYGRDGAAGAVDMLVRTVGDWRQGIVGEGADGPAEAADGPADDESDDWLVDGEDEADEALNEALDRVVDAGSWAFKAFYPEGALSHPDRRVRKPAETVWARAVRRWPPEEVARLLQPVPAGAARQELLCSASLEAHALMGEALPAPPARAFACGNFALGWHLYRLQQGAEGSVPTGYGIVASVLSERRERRLDVDELIDAVYRGPAWMRVVPDLGPDVAKSAARHPMHGFADAPSLARVQVALMLEGRLDDAVWTRQPTRAAVAGWARLAAAQSRTAPFPPPRVLEWLAGRGLRLHHAFDSPAELALDLRLDYEKARRLAAEGHAQAWLPAAVRLCTCRAAPAPLDGPARDNPLAVASMIADVGFRRGVSRWAIEVLFEHLVVRPDGSAAHAHPDWGEAEVREASVDWRSLCLALLACGKTQTGRQNPANIPRAFAWARVFSGKLAFASDGARAELLAEAVSVAAERCPDAEARAWLVGRYRLRDADQCATTVYDKFVGAAHRDQYPYPWE